MLLCAAPACITYIHIMCIHMMSTASVPMHDLLPCPHATTASTCVHVSARACGVPAAVRTPAS